MPADAASPKPTPKPAPQSPAQGHHDTNVVETIQSLIVAFVLAMTFRGFVTEGFVIPTGSMAPTLLGRHVLVHSRLTGAEFAAGLDQAGQNQQLGERLCDPMLGPAYTGSVPLPVDGNPRMGDRILVLKCLYPFTEPKRFDVVVFKNPTDPVGDAANYIKRLVGLPNETVWLTDGDVFSQPVGESEYQIRRKPEHVQRAVWQPIHHSDYMPVRLDYLDRASRRYEGPPWVGDDHWDTTGRSYTCNSAQASMLVWDNTRRQINDWNPYNTFGYGSPVLPRKFVPVSDIRISAAIVAQQPGLQTTLEIEARSHQFQFIIEQPPAAAGLATATLRMRPLDRDSEWTIQTAEIDLPQPGEPFNVEFWHADQALHLFINGERAMPPLEYNWSALDRLRYATATLTTTDVDTLIRRAPEHAQIRWRFEGSPLTLHRMRLDRDLYYRSDDARSPSSTPFGTHPARNNQALGPEHYMMCGDNSQASSDSRLWGEPHPLIFSQIDEAPYLVNRKLLLGKAWVVYFPAPHSITERVGGGSGGGTPVIPDFGRLRFIR